MTQALAAQPSIRPDVDTSDANSIAIGVAAIAAVLWLVAAAALGIGTLVISYILCVASLGCIVAALTRQNGFLDYRTLLTFSGTLYAGIGSGDVFLGSNLIALNPAIAALNTFISTAFLLAFGTPCIFLEARRRRARARSDGGRNDGRARQSVLIPLLLVGALTPIYLYEVSYVAETAGSRAEILSSSSVFFAGILYAMLTGLIVIGAGLKPDIEGLLGMGADAAAGTQPPPRIGQITAVALLVLLLILTQFVVLGNRREILSFLAALVVAVGITRPPLLTYPIAGFLIWFSTVLPYLRQAPVSQWLELITNFSTYYGGIEIRNTEHAAFSIIADVYYSAPNVSNFPTMLDAFGTLVPRVLWEDRPMPAGEWFVATFFPDLYRVGGGLAYNLPMETVMNLGWLGPILIPVLMAFGIDRAGGDKPSAAALRASIVLAWLFWLRYDTATLVKSVVLVFPFVVIWLLIQRTITPKASRL